MERNWPCLCGGGTPPSDYGLDQKQLLTSTGESRRCKAGLDDIVPSGAYAASLQVEGGHFLIGDLDTLLVLPIQQADLNLETCFRGGISNVAQLMSCS
jgi:hypothetical protein